MEDAGEGRLADVLAGWKSKAAIRVEQEARATEDEALARQITTISAESKNNSAAIQQESIARTTADESLAQNITTLQSSVGDNTAAIQSEATARANADSALAQDITTLQSSVSGNASAIQQEQTARANADSALAQQINTVQASVGENTAAVQQVSQAQADLEGNVSAMWKVSMNITADGKYYASGFGLSYENGSAGLQSTFAVLADKFVVLNQVTGTTTAKAVFAVTGGQAILNSAIIGDATIDFAKITNSLQSTNYVSQSTGWKMDKNGTLEINGSTSGQGRMAISNTRIDVFDGAGALAVRIGRL
jgi:predicted phage tail protein